MEDGEDLIEFHVSPARLSPFLDLADGNRTRAIELYEWNVRMAGAFHELLSDVEVIIRNAWSRQLMEYSLERTGESDWTKTLPDLLGGPIAGDIERAEKRLRNKGKQANLDSLTAEMTLAFWKYLFAKRFRSTLWPAAGKRAFPGAGPNGIESMSRWMAQVYEVRNRVAHHEPLIRRRIRSDFESCMALVRAVDGTLAEWVEGRSRIPALLEGSPTWVNWDGVGRG